MAQRVTFSAKSGAASGGEIALPQAEKAPALILLQEWWGINDHIRSLVDRFAAAGFVALAPDLYHGTTTKDAGEAQKLMTELDGKRAIDDIMGAFAFLKSHARSTGKVGVTGFCMGGAYALAAACALPELGAAVPFYGIPPAQNADYSKCKAPIQMHVATRDQWVTPAAAEGVKKQLSDHGQSIEICTYEADHAFMNDTRPEVFSPEASKLAWDRAVQFLHAHLG